MKYSVVHLSDTALNTALAAVVRNENATTAIVLAHIAEFDRRRLWLSAGYSSMFRYCIRVLHLSEQAAYKRILAARAARRFRPIFDAVADGRLHLSAIVLLAPHLQPGNATALLAESAHKTKSEVERMLAQRYPKQDVPTMVRPIPAVPELSPGIVEGVNALLLHSFPEDQGSREPACAAPEPQSALPPARVAALAPHRFEWRLTVDQETQDLASEARELLSHQNARHELPRILHDALFDYVARLRKQKFAAAENPQPQKRRKSNDPRYIPNAVKRAVWERDGGQCTFRSESGHRCEERSGLEYDHIDPVARGGTATVRNTRLLCHAHNQFEAERVFGVEFMKAKRSAAAG